MEIEEKIKKTKVKVFSMHMINTFPFFCTELNETEEIIFSYPFLQFLLLHIDEACFGKLLQHLLIQLARAHKLVLI